MPKGKTKQEVPEEKVTAATADTENNASTETDEIPTEENKAVDTENNASSTGVVAKENKAPDFEKKYTVINENKANKKSLGVDGNLIEFDSTGKAIVDYSDAKRFATIDGYKVEEE